MNEEKNIIKLKNGKSGRFSTLSIIILLLIIATGITFHIYNVLTVNELVVKNEDLRKKLERVKANNDYLKKEIERLSSLQRILPLARELGLDYSKEEIKYLDNE